MSSHGYLSRAEELMADAVGAEQASFSNRGSSLSVKAEYLAFAQVPGPGSGRRRLECLARVPGRFEEPATVQALRFRRLTVGRFVNLMTFTGFLEMIASSKTGLD
jgi:hypothetical protein